MVAFILRASKFREEGTVTVVVRSECSLKYREISAFVVIFSA